MKSTEPELETLDAADLRVVDMLCKRAGAEENALLREALTRLARACAEGSLCLPMEESGITDTARYAAILGSASEPRPLILHRNRLYFHRHFHAEKKLAEGFLQRLREEPVSCDPAAAQSVFHEILEARPLRTQGTESHALELTERQKWALAAAMRERIFLLSGGPGTGKTALTASLLRALIRLRKLQPDRIRLCAPTGRAAQRLQESLRGSLASLSPFSPEELKEDPDALLLNVQVETLHRMLGYHPPTGRFARNPGDPLRADFVLLDEASMADAFTLSALVQALPPETALVLVGDADQLPAVESGSVLGELLPSNRQPALSPETWKWIGECFPESLPDRKKRFPPETLPTVILDRSHRARQSLLDLAEAVQRGDATTAVREFHLEDSSANTAALSDSLDAYSQSLFLEQGVDGRTYVEWLRAARENPGDTDILSALMEFLNRERILTCARYGAFGCERINELLRKKLESPFENQTGGRRFPGFHGAPILVTRNDAATGLSNGEIGIWLRDDSGLTAWFQRGPEWRSFPAALLPSWELAFATTVHKSQGSECDAVLLVLPEAGNRLLTREILYTAITRARKSVKIFGSEAALREAIENRLKRYSGLREYFTDIP